MRAALCKQLGKPESLVIEEVAPPPLHTGGVRIEVHACGVNFADTLLLSGNYQERPKPPFSPGLEVAGVVRECDKAVTSLKPGERVVAHISHGGYAEEVVADEGGVFPIPEGMDFETAAGFLIAYGTSHLSLARRGRLQAGETLLVHGAASSVGLTAIEIGRQLGATVIATAGSAAKLALADRAGADYQIDYRREDIREAVRALTGGRGADVIFDPVGAQDSLRHIAWEGRILVIGFAGGAVPQFPGNLLLVKNAEAIGVYWGSYTRHRTDAVHESMNELFAWYEEGKLHPYIAHRFPLEEAASAIGKLLSRSAGGKMVLTMGREQA
jgi:NADPH2:quinone reductase